jgi:hypothetical protein
MRMMALSDMTTLENTSLRKGFVKGHAEGRAENARKMKAQGFSTAQIQSITGLAPEAIETL